MWRRTLSGVSKSKTLSPNSKGMRKDTAYLVTVEGAIREIAPHNGTDFELEEVQKLVDGYVEVVPYTDGRVMIVNEEGKFCKDRNEPATKMALESGSIFSHDYLCGDVVICPEGMFL